MLQNSKISRYFDAKISRYFDAKISRYFDAQDSNIRKTHKIISNLYDISIQPIPKKKPQLLNMFIPRVSLIYLVDVKALKDGYWILIWWMLKL